MWEIDLSGQIYTFLLSLMLGAAFCLVYDTVRALELKARMSAPAIFLVDVLYFIVISLFEFCFFLVRTNGEIRGFVFVGQLAGFLAARKTLSRIYGFLLLAIFGLIKWIKKQMFRLIFAPICRFFNKIGRFSLQVHKKYSLFVKKCLKNHKGLVYTKEKCPQDGKRREAQ